MARQEKKQAASRPVKNSNRNSTSNDNTDRTSNQGRKEASGGSSNTNNRGHEKGR